MIGIRRPMIFLFTFIAVIMVHVVDISFSAELGLQNVGHTKALEEFKSRRSATSNECQYIAVVVLIHDLLFLPISTIESAVGKRLITHCCVSRLACSLLSGPIEPHSPQLQA